MNKKKVYYNQKELIKKHWWTISEYKNKFVEVEILGKREYANTVGCKYLIQLPNKTKIEVWEDELYFSKHG